MRIFFCSLALALGFSGAGPAAAQGSGDLIESHGISSFGALKYPADFPHFDYVNPDAPKGGTMSFRGFLASSTFDSLNQFILAGEPAQGLNRIYDTLLVRAYDEVDGYYGLLAETITYPEDRASVVYRLRAGARFADGAPVTAADVVWTVETLQAEGHPTYRNILRDVARVEALSEREVRATFAEGVATRDLIAQLGEVPILPAHYYESVDFTRSTLEPPLGSGPYLVDKVDPGRQIVYCANPDYWAADLPVNRGKNNFDCFRYEYFADRTAAFEALKAGVYHFHEEFFSAIWATGYEFPALDKGWVIREEVKDGRPSGAQGFYLNARLPKFQDRRVREAIGMMFNFEWSNETLFYGLYDRLDSYWENSPLEARGMAEGAELAVLERYRAQLPERIFTEPAYVPAVSSTRKTDRKLVRRANALLEEAGWVIGDDGLRRNGAGEVLSVTFIDDGPAFERIVLPFAENLKLLGIEARFELIDSAELEQRQEDFNYDSYVARLSVSLSPSLELRNLFGSDSADVPGTFNLAGVKDPVVDALIEEIIGAPSRAELEPRVKALDRVLRDKILWVPNWHKGTHWLAYWDVFGKPEVKPPYIRGEDYWWWDEGKYQALKAAGALR
ncbi:MAG: extracellular solute-binding protein [Silicimonas sp.]|nr:extracellular solute-binding protein [Silicimonas sp.]